jgi:hypothetical protein
VDVEVAEACLELLMKIAIRNRDRIQARSQASISRMLPYSFVFSRGHEGSLSSTHTLFVMKSFI